MRISAAFPQALSNALYETVSGEMSPPASHIAETSRSAYARILV